MLMDVDFTNLSLPIQLIWLNQPLATSHKMMRALLSNYILPSQKILTSSSMLRIIQTADSISRPDHQMILSLDSMVCEVSDLITVSQAQV